MNRNYKSLSSDKCSLLLKCKPSSNSHCVLSYWLQTVRKGRKSRQRCQALQTRHLLSLCSFPLGIQPASRGWQCPTKPRKNICNALLNALWNSAEVLSSRSRLRIWNVAGDLGHKQIRISVYMTSVRITCSASLLCVCVYVHTHTYIHIYVYEHGFILRKNIYLERHMSTLKTHSLTPQTFESPCDSFRFQ